LTAIPEGKSSVERTAEPVLASAIILVIVVTDFEVPYEYPDGKIILIQKFAAR